jgi:1-acyl-sn-glycerol-3-phosphate acyltransferase
MRSPWSVDESFVTRWRRRAVTIPAVTIGALLLTALSPVLLPVTLLVDLVRRKRFATTRFLLFAGVYLWSATIALAALFLSWLVCGTWLGARWERLYRHADAFQRLWARALYRGGEACFGVRTDVETVDFPDDAAGPFLVFARHTSVADTMLPLVVIRHDHEIPLRYVIKRELLVEPAIDVAGQRMPNAFVRRSGNDLSKEVEQVRKLARDLPRRQGVLIYPEGTRFSPKKHAERLASIRERDPERYDRVRGFRRMLPMRLGGPIAMLEERPDADVLFVAHTGFEAVASFERMINGALVGMNVKVQIRRVPAAQIPKDPAARAAWLDAEWGKMDRWVDALLTERGEEEAAAAELLAPESEPAKGIAAATAE